MKHLCIYHSGDLDGKCSGAIASRYLATTDASVELFGYNYGDDFPWDRIDQDTNVVMMDCSLNPFDKMLEIPKRARSFTWIDHHKTAINDYHELGQNWTGLRQLDQAACELTWKYYYDDEPMPRAVYLLGRYDIWAWKDVPDALEFQFGMRSVENEPRSAIWDALLTHPERDRETDALILGGKHILRYQSRQNAIYAEASAFPLEWEGLRFIASNAQMTNSQLFDSVFDEGLYDGMLTFGYRKGYWNVSLYSTAAVCARKDIDMGVLARKFGGGGHPQAAGFGCRQLPFDLPIAATKV